ncbi:MAG: glycosyltransferase family 9 protein [Ignavibacteriaceae bacterium]|nr:glycosyltransferase family 9 protein [Ignavibacteriaceae bacterium]
MKILVIALSGIGDALMSTPAIEVLKKHSPDSEIDALVMYRGSKEIFSTNQNLNKVIYFDFINEGALNSLKFISGLRKKYDASINVYPSNRKEYNVISFLIGAKKRTGVKYLRKNSFNLGFLNNIQVKENDLIHNVKTNLKLCETLLEKKITEEPKLTYRLPENSRTFSENFLKIHSVNQSELVIGFHAGCSTLKNHSKRRWEPEKFAELAKQLIEKHSAKILLFGGPDEKELKRNIFNLINSNSVFIVESESLSDSSAIMGCCKIFVTNDSSQMHIAAALNLRVIAIIGPTNLQYIYPWKTEHKIVSLNLDCSPCFFYSPRPLICSRNDVKFKCIKELTVEMVYNAVRDLV